MTTPTDTGQSLEEMTDEAIEKAYEAWRSAMTTPTDTRADGEAVAINRYFYTPITLKPLENPNHDPGERIVMDAETAHIGTISSSLADGFIVAVNLHASIARQLAEAHAARERLIEAMHKLLNVCDAPAHDSYTIYRAAEKANAILAALSPPREGEPAAALQPDEKP